MVVSIKSVSVGARARAEPHVHKYNMWTTYRGTDTHIHRNSDFLVVMIGVELAQARPNYIDLAGIGTKTAPMQFYAVLLLCLLNFLFTSL